MSPTTQSDIAKKLNVTRITVSKALRNHPDISVEMKERVKKVAEELGYVPNLIAKNLTSKKTLTIGVVIPDLENSFFAYLVDKIIDSVSEKNYHAFITVSREKQENEKKNIKNLIGMRVDGLLVCVSQQTTDPDIFYEVKKMNIPLVFFDRQFVGLGFRSVSYNNKIVAIEALSQIIKEGYTKIAHFAGYSSVSIGKERCDSYKFALQLNGIETDNEWIVEGGFEVKDGYNSFMKLYHSQNLPEIIFTVNDRVAMGVYNAAKEVGLKIPEDIGIVGFGFKDTAQSFSPSLCVINQDPRKIGQVAVDTLFEEINNPGIENSQNIFIKEEFIWNNSILRRVEK